MSWNQYVTTQLIATGAVCQGAILGKADTQLYAEEGGFAVSFFIRVGALWAWTYITVPQLRSCSSIVPKLRGTMEQRRIRLSTKQPTCSVSLIYSLQLFLPSFSDTILATPACIQSGTFRHPQGMRLNGVKYQVRTHSALQQARIGVSSDAYRSRSYSERLKVPLCISSRRMEERAYL
jgi:hypothetical protein